MAYRRTRRSYSRGNARGSTGYSSRARTSRAGTRKRTGVRAASRGQTVRLIIEQAPASPISRSNQRVLSKMAPPSRKARM